LVLGLPLYGAFLRSILSSGLKGLKRDDLDYIHLAHAYGCQGRIEPALEALSKVKHHNAHSDNVRYMAYLKSGMVPEAIHWSLRAFHNDRRTMEPPTRDDAYTEFFLAWSVLPSAARKALCEHANSDDDFSQGARFLANSVVRKATSREGSKIQFVVANSYNIILSRFSGTTRDDPDYDTALEESLLEIEKFPETSNADMLVKTTLHALFLLDKTAERKSDEFDRWFTQHSKDATNAVAHLKHRNWGQILIIILADMIVTVSAGRNQELVKLYSELRQQAATELRRSELWKYISHTDGAKSLMS
jgi:hypothetical protein